MVFILLTLLAALSLAGVSGWFSIVGIMAIYAGAPIYALVMGIVLELGKLVSTSWIYRNWNEAGWLLKGPLIGFTVTLMLITSIGVFGFLSKSHLEQGAKTIDNAPRVERFDQQIAREKSVISDNEKVIGQLDATINSYLGKDRADRSVVIRRNQAPQRKQLRDEIDAANKRIDEFNEEKFKLQSQIRGAELEVGPIRYISELIYSSENNSTKNIESAVKIFTLLIVSTLDPLAIILLVAANHSIMRRQNKKKEIKSEIGNEAENPHAEDNKIDDTSIQKEELGNIEKQPDTIGENLASESKETTITKDQRPELQDTILEKFRTPMRFHDSPIIRSPNLTRVISTESVPVITEEENPVKKSDYTEWMDLGGKLHFIPIKIDEEEKSRNVEETTSATNITNASGSAETKTIEEIQQDRSERGKDEGSVEKHDSQTEYTLNHKYPKALSWLREFRRRL